MDKETGKRKSRFHRSEKPARIILQDRDKRIIAAVYEYRFLTRSQIQMLFGIDCLTRANVRLRKLFDNGYLDRLFRPTLIGTSQSIYTIGKTAIPFIAQLKGQPERDVNLVRKRTLALKEHSLEHDLLVNDFRISIVNEIRAYPNFDLVFWHNAQRCEHRFEVRNYGKVIRSSLRPDGYFRIMHGGRVYSFFLEIDRGTSSLDKLLIKFRNYLDFGNLGLYDKAYGLKTFYVLVVTNSIERRNSLKKIADELSSNIFWFGTGHDMKANWLTEGGWLRSGSSEIRVLFNIAGENKHS